MEIAELKALQGFESVFECVFCLMIWVKKTGDVTWAAGDQDHITGLEIAGASQKILSLWISENSNVKAV
jgi:hypothetical protein